MRTLLGISALQLKVVTGWGAGPLCPTIHLKNRGVRPTIRSLVVGRGSEDLAEKEMTPTDRLSDFGSSLATSSDSVERVPRGQNEQ
jgi:hypothetical protein